MIVSTKGRYALRVMIDLAEHQTERYVPLKEVAARQEISEKYLANILKVLVQNGYIAVDGEGNLTLLEPGRAIAERIYSRHRLLTHFFVQLGVDEAIAAEDACKAEHILSEQTLEKNREYALLHDAQDSVKPQGE